MTTGTPKGVPVLHSDVSNIALNRHDSLDCCYDEA
jgi:hypothetical protein